MWWGQVAGPAGRSLCCRFAVRLVSTVLRALSGHLWESLRVTVPAGVLCAASTASGLFLPTSCLH